ncbi:RNase H domain-containing protein [Trichonephila clavipes]|nr:RNase H domain-containing protein [Trichonephila clavipes]
MYPIMSLIPCPDDCYDPMVCHICKKKNSTWRNTRSRSCSLEYRSNKWSCASDSDYEYALTVFDAFECQTFSDYLEIYQNVDVIMLAEIFLLFRRTSMQSYHLDPLNFITSAQLTWNAGLKISKVELLLLGDVNEYLWFEKSMKGVCLLGRGYAVIDRVMKNLIQISSSERADMRDDSIYYVYLPQHEIYFQWIPSHIGLFGNDTADLLAKEGVTENLMSRRTLTFSEIFSKTKSLIQELWKTPLTHPWYNRQAPGGTLSIKADRVVQTTISRLASGHIRGLSFNLGQKIYENCTKCNLVQATQIIFCFVQDLKGEDIYSSPLLVYDFLRTLGLMDLV